MGLVAGVWTGSRSGGGWGSREHAARWVRGGYDLQRLASPSDLLWSVRANLPKFSRKTSNGAISWRSRAQTHLWGTFTIRTISWFPCKYNLNFTLLGDSVEEAIFGAEGFQNNSGPGRGWRRAGAGVGGKGGGGGGFSEPFSFSEMQESW